ncbi:DUF86 domain-containing protein [Candidatus Woesearchaeota archaeon]|nr:DUF86 domain-containing protein [Candidatus Woesearchaeota archaeon]
MIKKIRLPAEGRIADKLDELTRYYDELLEDLPTKDDFEEKRVLRRSIEKTLELIADTITDIALILISEFGFEKPLDAREAIDALVVHKILTKQLGEKIKDLISFRNLLVHRYGKIDVEREYETIQEDHGDIQEFIKEIDTHLKSA